MLKVVTYNNFSYFEFYLRNHILVLLFFIQELTSYLIFFFFKSYFNLIFISEVTSYLDFYLTSRYKSYLDS